MTHTKVRVRLVGEDGNIFVIMARVSAALRKSGQPHAATELWNRVVANDGTGPKSYSQALAIVLEYCEPEDPEDRPSPELDELIQRDRFKQDEFLASSPEYARIREEFGFSDS